MNDNPEERKKKRKKRETKVWKTREKKFLNTQKKLNPRIPTSWLFERKPRKLWENHNE